MTRDQKSAWYNRLIKMAGLQNPRERFDQLTKLHSETLALYLPAIQAMTEEQAWKPSSDGRSIALVVAHIMAWEDWQIQAFTDPDRKNRLNEQMQDRKST